VVARATAAPVSAAAPGAAASSGVIAPATAAGAMVSAPTPPEPQAPADAAAVRRVPLAQTAAGARQGESDDETVVKPPPAIPLVSRPAAIAEPVGVAQAATEDPDADEGPDTAETAIAALPAPPAWSNAPSDAGAAAPEPVAERELPSSPSGETTVRRERRSEEPGAGVSGAAAVERQERSPVGPATAAGAAGTVDAMRTRFPPAPPTPEERAAPVGAASRVSGGAPPGGARTLRRERPRQEDDAAAAGGRGGSGSTPRLVIVAVVLVGALIFAASQLLSSGKGPATTTTNSGTHSLSGPPASTIRVAVLNGTSQSGLAGRVSQTLVSDGFRRGAIANAPSQTRTSTVVAYTPGNREAAVEVALSLALTTTQVVPADTATEAAATSQGVSPTAIVVLGSNYAQK
jgi:hypothetical protein